MCIVIMIGRWSEGCVWTHHVVFCSNVEEQKVMSEEEVWQCGMRVCSVLFTMDMLNCVMMCPSSVVLILTVPSCVFGIEVFYY